MVAQCCANHLELLAIAQREVICFSLCKILFSSKKLTLMRRHIEEIGLKAC